MVRVSALVIALALAVSIPAYAEQEGSFASQSDVSPEQVCYANANAAVTGSLRVSFTGVGIDCLPDFSGYIEMEVSGTSVNEEAPCTGTGTCSLPTASIGCVDGATYINTVTIYQDNGLMVHQDADTVTCTYCGGTGNGEACTNDVVTSAVSRDFRE